MLAVADQLRGVPGQRQAGLDGVGVRLDAVHGEREPERQAAGAPGQVVGVVGGVPLVALGVQHVQVGGVLGVHGTGELRVAVDQRGAVERREQPLVRVDDEGVGVLDAVVALPDGGGEQARAAVGAVDVEPQAALAGDLGQALEVVDDALVGGAAGADDGDHRLRVRVGGQGGAQRLAGEPAVDGRDLERLDADDVEGVLDRGVHLVGDCDPQPDLGATGSTLLGELAAGRVPGDDQGGEVAGRAAGDEGAAGRGRHARAVGYQAQHLVLGGDRAGRLQPGDALQRGAGDHHVEEQRGLGGGARDERQVARAVGGDHRAGELVVVELEHVGRVVAVLVEQAGQLGAQVLAVTGVVERDRVVLQPLAHVVENQVDQVAVGPVHAVGGCGHGCPSRLWGSGRIRWNGGLAPHGRT